MPTAAVPRYVRSHRSTAAWPAHRWSSRSRRRPPARRDPQGSRVAYPRLAVTALGMRAPRERPCRATRTGNDHDSTALALETDPDLLPSRSVRSSADGQVVEQLVGEDDAGCWHARQRREAHDDRATRHGRRARRPRRVGGLAKANAGGWSSRCSHGGAWARTPRRARSATPGTLRGGGEDRASQRARAGAGLDDREHVWCSGVCPPTIQRAATTAPNSGPTSGLVMKSPRRPACPAGSRSRGRRGRARAPSPRGTRAARRLRSRPRTSSSIGVT